MTYVTVSALSIAQPVGLGTPERRETLPPIGRQATMDRYMLTGKRVETHPATDAWMQGDRYGVVRAVGRRYVHVMMDRSQRVRRFLPANVTPIGE